MNLVAPLFLGLLALAAVVVLLHIQRRRSVTVPSVEIWRRLQSAGPERQRRLEWPRPNLLMALQVAIVAAIALALAQPIFGGERPADHVVVVVDGSASMQARDGEASRFDAALAAVGARAETVHAERVSLIEAGVAPALLLARQPADAERIAAALDGLLPADGPIDWTATRALLDGVVRADETTRIVFVSDDAVPDALAGVSGVATVAVGVGAPLGNAGLDATMTAADAATGTWTLDGEAAFYGGVQTSTLTVAYTPEAGGPALTWTTVELGDAEAVASDPADGAAPPEADRFSVDLELPGPGVVTATLSPDAGLFDNKRWFILRDAPATLDVLYVGGGEQPLVRALQAVDGVSVFQAEGLPEDLDRFGLVVVDGVEVARAPETNTVWISGGRVAGSSEPVQLAASGPTNWRSDHALASGIRWANVEVDAALTMAVPDTAEVLLEAEGAPLVAAETGPDGRAVFLAFDPALSNWPEQPSFPVFVQNLVAWLGPQPGGLTGPSCTVGEACPLDARFIGGTISRLEGGPARPAEATPPAADVATGGFVPRWAGLYRLEKDGRTSLFAVNAAAGAESDLRAQPTAEAAAAAVTPTALWPVLIGLVLVLLVVEGVLAGRGPERFLKAAGLRRENPLSGRRRTLLGLRVATLVFALFALLNLPALWSSVRENLVLVVLPPLSDSPVDTTEGLIARGEAEAGAAFTDRKMGVVARSTDARIAADLGEEAADLGRPAFAGDGGTALMLAAAMLPAGEPGRIVLTADAAQSGDDLAGVLERLRARDIAVDVTPAEAVQPGEALVQGLEAPYPLFAGDSFPLTGRIYAESATTAEVTVLRDDQLLAAQDVELRAGHNRIETMIDDLDAGSALYEMLVAAEGDGVAENNRNGLWITARPPGSIAVVAPQPEQGQAFADALIAQGYEATVMEPDRAPFTLADWLGYQGIVLVNVPAIDLTVRQQELIETAVSEHGLGLMILGGANSFGPGGYLETTLERLSPLSSRVPREAPEVALVFVLDRSGSMQQMVGDVTRLDVAKRATLAAVDLLNEQSRVGVIVFDSEAQVIMPLEVLGAGGAVPEALSSVDTGGGTSIYPGLVEAFAQLRGVEAPARHVIVMTDGLSQPGDFPGILAEMRAEGITVSAVAVGEGAEMTMVESIAAAGGGTFHASTDFAALPSILSQEAMLLSGSPIEELTSEPRWVGSGESFLVGLPTRMPAVEGFVLTTPKPDANVSLVTPDSRGELMPLLASWRYGNGNVLALTTEATGAWTRQWQGLADYPRLWGQAMRAFLPGTPPPGLELTTRRRSDKILVRLQALDPDGTAEAGLDLVATVTPAAGGEPIGLQLTETLPGRYEGSFVPPASGDYDVAVTVGEAEAVAQTHVAYPARFDFSEAGHAQAALADATGGRVLGAGDALFAGGARRWVTEAGWPLWTLVALGLFMADLFVRYASLQSRIASLIPWRRRRAASLEPA